MNWQNVCVFLTLISFFSIGVGVVCWSESDSRGRRSAMWYIMVSSAIFIVTGSLAVGMVR